MVNIAKHDEIPAEIWMSRTFASRAWVEFGLSHHQQQFLWCPQEHLFFVAGFLLFRFTREGTNCDSAIQDATISSYKSNCGQQSQRVSRGIIFLPERGFLYFRRNESPLVQSERDMQSRFLNLTWRSELSTSHCWRYLPMAQLLCLQAGPDTHTQLLSRYKSIYDDNWRSSHLVTLGPGPCHYLLQLQPFWVVISQLTNILSVEDHECNEDFILGLATFTDRATNTFILTALIVESGSCNSTALICQQFTKPNQRTFLTIEER